MNVVVSGYKDLTKLGEGSYGFVYRAIDSKTNNHVVIKHLKSNHGHDEGILSTTLREIHIMKTLHHKNILSLINVTMNRDEIFLILEPMEYDLHDLIHRTRGSLRPSTSKSYAKQLLEAVAYMHSINIAHRDLKPSNILLDSHGNLKVADFGLARPMTLKTIPTQRDIEMRKAITSLVVTLWYRPPELLLNATTYSTEIDMWSVGCIISEMNTGQVLFCGDSELNQVLSIFKVLGTPPLSTMRLSEFPVTFQKYKPTDLSLLHKGCSLSLLMLIKSCLSYDLKERITAKAALDHVYLIL